MDQGTERGTKAEGALTRRTMVGALAAIPLFLTACADRTSQPTSGGGGGGAAGAAPKGIAGETLTVQYTGPTSMNPALGPVGQAGVTYIYPAYGSLTFQTEDGEFVPELATKWGYKEGSDNKVFAVTLRPGLKFADGSPLNAQAAVNSIQFFKGANGPQSHQLATLTSAKAVDDTNFELTFSEPMPYLEYLFSQSQGLGAIIGPKGLADPRSLASTSDGAGPYTITAADIIENNQYTFQANPNYWNQDAIHFRKLVVKVITDANTVVNSMRTGQLDAALRLDTVSSGTAARSAGMNVMPSPFGFVAMILADRAGQSSPLGDLKVRQAINHALDRTALAKLLDGDDGLPTNQLSVKGALGYSDKAAELYPFDVDKAKSLLAEAGHPNGFTLPALASAGNDPGSVLGQAVASQLDKIGIKIELKVVPGTAQLIPEALSKKYPAIFQYPPFFGPGFYYHIQQALGSFLNPFDTKDEQLTKLLNDSRGAAPAERDKLYTQVSERLTELAWFAPISAKIRYFTTTQKIAGANAPNVKAPGVVNPLGPDPERSWYPKQ